MLVLLQFYHAYNLNVIKFQKENLVLANIYEGQRALSYIENEMSANREICNAGEIILQQERGDIMNLYIYTLHQQKE